MKPARTAWVAAAVLVLGTLSCVTIPPPAPLWDPSRYQRVLVLPTPMEVSTGAPPFTSVDMELSDSLAVTLQQSLFLLFNRRGYQPLAPLDANDRLWQEEELRDAYFQLATRHRMTPGGKGDPPEGDDALAAATLSRGMEADLLVLAGGMGQYHGVTEALVQGVIGAIFGQQNHQMAESFLQVRLVVLDGATGRLLARLGSGRFSYTRDLHQLVKRLEHAFRRIPSRHDPAAPPH